MSRVVSIGHFPFVVPHATAAAGALCVPLATAMKWYWRVKSWQITLSLDGAVLSGTNPRYDPGDPDDPVDDPPTGGSPTETATIGACQAAGVARVGSPDSPLNDSPTVAATDETVLVGGAVGASLDSADTPNAGSATISGNPYAPGTLAVDGRVGLSLFYPASYINDGPRMTYDPATGLFCPNVSILATFSMGGAPQLLITIRDSPLGGAPYFHQRALPVTCTIDGQSMTVYGIVTWYVSSESDDSTCTVGTPMLTITPLEYWPYADANGAALYDTATGAAL